LRYESSVNSAGGDDVALAKSFIIACQGPTTLSLQLGRPQHQIHSSISDIPWYNSRDNRSVQLQAER
jgi:hypothetical protein